MRSDHQLKIKGAEGNVKMEDLSYKHRFTCAGLKLSSRRRRRRRRRINSGDKYIMRVS
jgi:hypothetical protein